MYWSREDTRHWIEEVESRIEDIDFFLKKTVKWCEDNYVYEDDRVFMCSFLTCIWVTHQRGELITYSELLEILGLGHFVEGEDKVYELDDQFSDLDHEDLLKMVKKTFSGF